MYWAPTLYQALLLDAGTTKVKDIFLSVTELKIHYRQPKKVEMLQCEVCCDRLDGMTVLK